MVSNKFEELKMLYITKKTQSKQKALFSYKWQKRDLNPQPLSS